MNKILPIILVVVLSGCGGKAPLENCADKQTDLSNYLFNDALSLENRPWNIKKDVTFQLNRNNREAGEEGSVTINPTKKEIRLFINNKILAAKYSPARKRNVIDIRKYNQRDSHRINWKDYEKKIGMYVSDVNRIKEKYDNKTLKEKFEYKEYFSSYMKCEKMKKLHPESFNAFYE